MKNILLLFGISFPLLFVACKNDDDHNEEITTNLKINLRANYDNEPLQMQKEYTYCDGERQMKFTGFDFYISEIVLLKENDPQTPVTELKEIDFVSLSFTDQNDAMDGQDINIQNVPVGEYSGIQLGLGVAADLNRTSPEDYGSSSPLSNVSHYWDAWNSYIFLKLDGYADLDNDGTIVQGGADSEGFSYHTGTDDVYAKIQIMQPITLEEGKDGALNIKIDASAAFNTNDATYSDGNGCLNIQDYFATHTDTELLIAKKIMQNLAASATMEQ